MKLPNMKLFPSLLSLLKTHLRCYKLNNTENYFTSYNLKERKKGYDVSLITQKLQEVGNALQLMR
jgi:hypothetical protein